MAYWNLTWFAFASADWTLGDASVYNTLVRVMSPYDRLGTSLVKLFNYYGVYHSFIHSFIDSFILETCIAPLPDTTPQRRSQPSHVSEVQILRA